MYGAVAPHNLWNKLPPQRQPRSFVWNHLFVHPSLTRFYLRGKCPSVGREPQQADRAAGEFREKASPVRACGVLASSLGMSGWSWKESRCAGWRPRRS